MNVLSERGIFGDVKRFLLHTLIFVQNHRAVGPKNDCYFCSQVKLRTHELLCCLDSENGKNVGLLKFNCGNRNMIWPHCLSIKKFNEVQMKQLVTGTSVHSGFEF